MAQGGAAHDESDLGMVVVPQAFTVAGACLKDPWVRTPIDAFIAAKLSEQKLKPARKRPTVGPWFDAPIWTCTACRPTAEQVEKFVRESEPDAYEKLIDELLASPRYGESGAATGSDLTRYGDTAGFEQDPIFYTRGVTATMSSIPSITISLTTDS
jgi:hypothetical protein